MRRVWMQWPDNDLFGIALYRGKMWYVDIYRSSTRLYLHREQNSRRRRREERDILEMADWDREHGSKPEWADVRDYEEGNREFQETLRKLEALV